MWIVDLALRRPLTFIVLAIFILISGVLCILKTPKDIFPNIDIPVVSVIFNFAGMSPEQIEAHITSPYERVLTTTVDDIQHIESPSGWLARTARLPFARSISIAIWETACKCKVCPKVIRSSSILRMVWLTVMWSRSSQPRHRLPARPVNSTRTFSERTAMCSCGSVLLVCAWRAA